MAPADQSTADQSTALGTTPPPIAEPLRSVFTANLPNILAQLKISLAVSTYQAGKVILVRYDEQPGSNGESAPVGIVNTHFRNFAKPMGMALHVGDHGVRLTVGGANRVTELRNMPAVARKLEPGPSGRGKHDACFLPRSIHITGDIDIHELAWGRSPVHPTEDDLWIVNTRFSCLCTLDIDHSFYPRWRPHFVRAYAPEDRCHLNGLALVDGKPTYVTALGETDTPGGWRANKANGGILMDVARNEVLVRGLSMPHSPRWYNNKLYLLESGEGAFSVVDLAEARKTKELPSNVELATTKVATLPGFTRGIDFYGPLAFIGLSQVRESATFSGLPIIERLGEERNCGVWVVNIHTGETLAFLRFESGVQEIFAVQVLPNMCYPEILDWDDERMGLSYVLPDAALREVPNAELA